jgi:hypothetical protein
MAIYTEDNQHSDGRDSIAYTPYYFDVHVFFSRTEGYSIPVKITGVEDTPTEDEVIQFCVDNNKFGEEGDERYVDHVDEIDVKEYKLMVQS